MEELNLFLEVSAVILNAIYLILLMKEKKACWYFGIAASLLSILLFYNIGLYSESILYVYYVIIGFYGLSLWNRKGKEEIKIRKIGWSQHGIIIGTGIVLSFCLGYIFDTYTDAVNPYLDSTTTIFSFIASYLEAKKIISSWVFWIFINAATVVLYLREDLSFYLVLTIVYFIFSVLGYREWHKKMNEDKVILIRS